MTIPIARFLARLLLFTLSIAAFADATAAQQEHVTTVTAKVHYLLFLPKTYSDKGEALPLMIFLHGSGERGNDLELVKKWGPPAIAEKNPDFPFILISPQAPADSWWHASEIKAVIDEVIATHNVDRHRVYITGLSMGGFGTWELAAAYPDMFAAAAPICGGGDPFFASRLKQVPVWAFHGKKDNAVPEEQSAGMVAALKAAGGDVKYTVLPDGGHVDAWVYAYGPDSGLFDWLLQHRKP
ncbi:MAG: prolyl oligopeptidase family serine peptidase [Burkholderiaceae bacterium]|nr:prolyl oligopeptidase family serine peptidase [Burkholderiaceae bacterium]